MTKTEYAELLKRPEWKARRADIINKAYGRCGQCHKFVKHFHVHHLYYEGDNNPWEYPDDALVALCFSCHNKKHDNYILHMVTRKSTAEKDVDFLKVYPTFLFAFMRCTSVGGQFRLLIYILKEAMDFKINKNNMIYLPSVTVCEICKISRPSFYRFIKIFIKIGLITSVPDSNSIYRINPDMVYKGNLVKYYSQVQEETNE